MTWKQLENITSLDSKILEINDEGKVRKIDSLECIPSYINKAGYPSLKLLLNNYKKEIPIHRLQLFVSGEDPSLSCHHINHIKTDNRRTNLMFMSNSEHTKLHRKDEKLKEENKLCYVPYIPVSIIRFIYFCRVRKLLTVKYISSTLQISSNTVYSIQNKTSYKRIINYYFGKDFK